MNSALSPREIQARLRAGASVPEVAADAGVEVDKIAGFAVPVMAERAHMTRTALASSVRRRGDSSGHRRLGDLIHDRLQARGLDADTVEWDSWRQNDLRWRVVGLLDDQAASRAAEFVFDPKGRFSIAENADARWMIGEELLSPTKDPDNENTIDFHDEFALVRAVTETSSDPAPAGRPGDDVPPFESPYETSSHTSELDELYDLLSGVSEDSVRVYLGLDEDESSETRDADEGGANEGGANEGAATTAPDADAAVEAVDEEQVAEALSEHPDLPHDEDAHPDVPDPAQPAPAGVEQPVEASPSGEQPRDAAADGTTSPELPQQDPLVSEGPPSPPRRKPARKRASVPSWDEIMFGGPTRG